MTAGGVLLRVFAVVGVVAIPVVCSKYLAPPFYFWIGCGYLILASGLLFFVTSTRSKVVLVNLIAIMVTVTGFEWHLYSSRLYKEGRIENVYDGKYTIDHPELGYTLGASISRPEATKYLDDELIYQVSYSTNKHGLRRSMGGDREEGHFGCIFVYGGSFAYGEGLNDDETMAWQLDVLTGRRHRVFNFGLHGYGPHHMLASLESGHTASVAGCGDEPVVVIYQAISDHLRRALGLTSWDKQGPRYQLDDQGMAVHAGYFDETMTRGRLFHLLDESYIFRTVLGSNRPRRTEDVDLFLAIVEKARVTSSEQFDLQDFVVIYWDDGPQDTLPGWLDNHGLHAFRVHDIIPGSRSNDSEYRLDGDNHPSPLANEKLAGFIVARGLVPQRKDNPERYRTSMPDSIPRYEGQ